MKVSLHTDNRALNAALNRVVVAVGDELGPTVKRVARLAAVELAFRTQPYGKSSSVQKQGKDAVARDVRRVYGSPRDAYPLIKDKRLAAAFWQAVQAGRITEASRILEKQKLPALRAWDGGAAHRSARDKRGRVPDEFQRIPMAPSAGPRVERYIRQQQKLVGYVKSGWANAARLIGGTRGIPGWVSRNKGPGRAVDQSSRKTDPFVLVENLVPYLAAQLADRHYGEALQVVARNLLKSVDAIIRARLRAAGMAA